jgi:PST family polysaccharide transporter
MFDQPGLAPVLRGVSPLPLLTAIQAVPSSLFKRDLDFRALAMASAGGTVLGGAAGVGLALAGFGPWSLVTNLLIQNAAIAGVVWWKSGLRIKLLYSARHMAELWSFAKYTFLLRIASFMANQSPRILVGYMFGVAALGAFSLGLRMVEIMYQLLALPAANVAIPMIARVRHDPARLERAILSTLQLSSAISVPAFLGLALIAPLFVPLAFSAQWTDSIVIVQLLALSGIVGAIGLVSLNIVTGFGRPGINLAITTSAAVVSVAVMLLLSPWGLVAATMGFIIRGYLWAPMLFLLIARITAIPVAALFQACLPIAFAALPMGGAVIALLRFNPFDLTPLSLMTVAITAGAAIYWVGLRLFARPVLQLCSSLLSELFYRRSGA